MERKEFEEKYVGNNVVVNCKTKEDEETFLDLCELFGYNSYRDRGSNYKYEEYGAETCFNLNRQTFCNKRFYVNKGSLIRVFKRPVGVKVETLSSRVTSGNVEVYAFEDLVNINGEIEYEELEDLIKALQYVFDNEKDLRSE